MAHLKEEFEKLDLEKIKGEVIGLTLENYFSFILEKEGEEGVRRVEDGLAQLGYPLKHKEIKNFQWYPRIMDEAMYFATKRVLNWGDEVFRESGTWGPRVSYITRIMMKHLISIERVFREVSNYWRKYYTVGNLVPIEISTEEKYLIIELDIPVVCPEHCRYWEGYFWQVGAFVLPKEDFKLWETDCMLKGSNVHRFKATW